MFKLEIEQKDDEVLKVDKLKIIPFSVRSNSSKSNKDLNLNEVELNNHIEYIEYNEYNDKNKNNNINNLTNQDLPADIYSSNQLYNNFVSNSNNNNNFDNKNIYNDNSNNNVVDNKEIKTIKTSISSVRNVNTKHKKGVDINFMERFKLYYCWKCMKNPKEMIINKELSMAADKIIDNKTDIFELWKYLDQINILKKILLNENQRHMLNKIGKTKITNKERDLDNETETETTDLKDIVEEKEEAKNIKLINYCRYKKENNINNRIDDMIMYYLDDDMNSRVKE